MPVDDGETGPWAVRDNIGDATVTTPGSSIIVQPGEPAGLESGGTDAFNTLVEEVRR